MLLAYYHLQYFHHTYTSLLRKFPNQNILYLSLPTELFGRIHSDTSLTTLMFLLWARLAEEPMTLTSVIKYGFFTYFLNDLNKNLKCQSLKNRHNV